MFWSRPSGMKALHSVEMLGISSLNNTVSHPRRPVRPGVHKTLEVMTRYLTLISVMQCGVLCHKFIISFSEEVPYESLSDVSLCQSAEQSHDCRFHVHVVFRHYVFECELQCFSTSECLAAESTIIRCSICMQSSMTDKIGILRKCMVTDCAYEWFLPSVCPMMDIKVISCWKGFIAYNKQEAPLF